MPSLTPGSATNLRTLPLELEEVAADQRVDGDPRAGLLHLDDRYRFGLWEMSSGTMVEYETDEVLLVVSGEAEVEFLKPDLPPLTLTAGCVVRLATGMLTRWTVTSAIRAIYIDE